MNKYEKKRMQNLNFACASLILYILNKPIITQMYIIT